MITDPPVVTRKEWEACVSGITEARITELSTWRGWLRATCHLLKDSGAIGFHNGCWCFPNIDTDGDIRSIHSRLAPKPGEKARWFHKPRGAKIHALVWGDLAKAIAVAVFESQWDAGSFINALNLNPFADNKWALISTRGAQHAKALAELEIPASADVYVFPQNDEVGKRLTEAVAGVLNREVYAVETPSNYKDIGQWGLNGLTSAGLFAAIQGAALRRPVQGAPQQSSAPPDYTDEELKQLDRDLMERLRTKDRPFPAPMEAAAFYGLAGEIVDILSQDTEPCRESLLAQFLVAIGNVVGRSAYCRQGGTHHLNEFVVLIGETARGRKGTSWSAIENLIKAVDQDWVATRVRTGFQSGESIINAVRDQMIGNVPPSKRKFGQPAQTVTDHGVSDKRLMILEEEFARLLIVGGRKDNTLFSALRDAWDGKEYLYNEAKNSAQKATGALISMIGHVTAAELLRTLHQVEHLSGFSNRFLWVAAQRTKLIALPAWIDWRSHLGIISRLGSVIATFKVPYCQLRWSDSGKCAWREFYRSTKISGYEAS